MQLGGYRCAAHLPETLRTTEHGAIGFLSREARAAPCALSRNFAHNGARRDWFPFQRGARRALCAFQKPRAQRSTARLVSFPERRAPRPVRFPETSRTTARGAIGFVSRDVRRALCAF